MRFLWVGSALDGFMFVLADTRTDWLVGLTASPSLLCTQKYFYKGWLDYHKWYFQRWPPEGTLHSTAAGTYLLCLTTELKSFQTCLNLKYVLFNIKCLNVEMVIFFFWIHLSILLPQQLSGLISWVFTVNCQWFSTDGNFNDALATEIMRSRSFCFNFFLTYRRLHHTWCNPALKVKCD